MSAAAALARAEAAGVRFRLAPGGGVRMEADAPPPAEVLADLRRWRDDVARLLAARAPDWRSLPYGRARGVAFAAARRAAGACPHCACRRWWRGDGAQAVPRCLTCHPPPPGLAVREVAT